MGSVKIEDADDEVTDNLKNTRINPMNISITPELISEARKKVVLVMMVKNEEKRLEVSFNSVKDYVDTFVILDTGSTDRTTMIIKNYCKKHNINLFLKEEPFVDFAALETFFLSMQTRFYATLTALLTFAIFYNWIVMTNCAMQMNSSSWPSISKVLKLLFILSKCGRLQTTVSQLITT
jgi:glycosyltransferase involved in cell wall biosynthesis